MSDETRTPATQAAPRDEPIEVGAEVPAFTLPAVKTDGAEFDLTEADFIGPRSVLVFYQDDGMPTCTRELTAFAQEHELLDGAGVRVYGINTNGLGSHKKFQERDAFPFPLISDFHGDLIKALGFWDEIERKSRRAVIVVGEDGKVMHVEQHFNPSNLTAFEAIFGALGLFDDEDKPEE